MTLFIHSICFFVIYLFIWKWWPVSLALGCSKLVLFFTTPRWCRHVSESSFAALAHRPRLAETLSAQTWFLSSLAKFICLPDQSCIDCFTRWFNPFPRMLSALVLSWLDFNGVMINPSPTGLGVFSSVPRQRLNSFPAMHLSHTFPKTLLMKPVLILYVLQLRKTHQPSVLCCRKRFQCLRLPSQADTFLGFGSVGQI